MNKYEYKKKERIKQKKTIQFQRNEVIKYLWQNYFTKFVSAIKNKMLILIFFLVE